MYINEGNRSFLESKRNSFEGVYYSSVAFADIDGDLDYDLVISAADKSNIPKSRLFINDGKAHFDIKNDSIFVGVRNCSIAFSDLDSDGDLDLLIVGQREDAQLIAKIYLNNGLGKFKELHHATLEGVQANSIAICDVDGDGYQDIFISGINANKEYISKLYFTRL